MTKICTVTTLKCDLAQTLAFVNYHLKLGIDHMYLFFDNPDDEAFKFLDENLKITCFKVDEQLLKQFGHTKNTFVSTKQVSFATYAFHLAREKGYDWLIHLDADELLYCKGGLKKKINKLPKNVDVIIFPVAEAAPQKVKYEFPFSEISFFRFYGQISVPEDWQIYNKNKIKYILQFRAWKYKYWLAKKAGFINTKNKVLQRYILGHTQGKSAVRTRANIKNVLLHHPEIISIDFVLAYVIVGAYLLHFDSMGYLMWKKKWLGRVMGLNKHNPSDFSHVRKMQEDFFLGIYKNDDLDNLAKKRYFELYKISALKRIALVMLGLGKNIKLNKRDLYQNRT